MGDRMAAYIRILIVGLCLGIESCSAPEASTTTARKGPVHVERKKATAITPVVKRSPVAKRSRSVHTLAREEVTNPVAPGVNQAPEVTAIVNEAGVILRGLSQEQAEKALSMLEPGAPTNTAQAQIAELLMNAKTVSEAQAIQDKLRAAQQD